MSRGIHEVRERKAREGFEALGPSPSHKAVLTVQCDSAHHLGAVYDTPAGRVYKSVLSARAHGRKDLPDVGHHATRNGVDWYDLLDPGEDPLIADELQSGCECGPYQLSRKLLIDQITAGETRVIVA